MKKIKQIDIFKRMLWNLTKFILSIPVFIIVTLCTLYVSGTLFVYIVNPTDLPVYSLEPGKHTAFICLIGIPSLVIMAVIAFMVYIWYYTSEEELRKEKHHV